MITLDTLHVEQDAVISAVNATTELKRRLYSFGVSKGAILKVKTFSPAKNSMTITVNKTTMALRLDEAAQIEVTLWKLFVLH